MVVPTHIVDCVRRGDLLGLAEWLENGGDANDRTAEHDSLLCVLASSRDASPAVATLLLDAGAEWEDGMHIVTAAAHSNADFIRYLCSLGADPNYMCPSNWTPLHAAVRWHDTAVVAALLDCGGNPSIRIAPHGAPDGDLFEEQKHNPPTPLMCAAASSHHAEMVRSLLSHGADFSAKNLAGETAEDYAREALNLPARDEMPDPEDIAWHDDLDWRLAGEAERIIVMLADVRAAGSWKCYVGAWRVQLLLLQRLSATGRAFPRTELMERLVALPPPLVGKVASYWRTSRDPLD